MIEIKSDWLAFVISSEPHFTLYIWRPWIWLWSWGFDWKYKVVNTPILAFEWGKT